MKKPTKSQRLAKSKFWQRAANNPLIPDLDNPRIFDVERLSGTKSIRTWFEDSEFKDWFLDQDSNKSLIASGCELAIEKLIYILELEGPDEVGPKMETTSAAQVKAAENMLRLGGFEPPKTVAKERYMDKEVEDMTPAQLEAYIANSTQKLRGVE